MLSAVAARKAAQAAAETSVASSTKPSSPPSSSSSSSPPPTPATASRPAKKAKRKPRNFLTGPSKNKKAKVAHASPKHDRNVRYFHPVDTPKPQHKDAVDDATARVEADSDTDSSSGEEMQMQTGVSSSAGPSAISITKTQRAWSPSRPMAESSDGEDAEPPSALDPVSYLAPSTPRKPEPLPLSTFRPVLNRNVYSVPENDDATNGKSIILVLQPNETVVLVAIRQQENTSAILVEYIHTGVEGLGRICRTFEHTFKPPRGSDAVPGTEQPRIHIVNQGIRDVHPFVLPSSWEAALASIEEQPNEGIFTAPICLIKGPKKSGKSTLARTLVNRLLSRYRRIAFLECDLGQSEFTPGGLVALNLVENYVFGPPFTHPSLPYRAHYVGSTSPRASPTHYLHSIQDLLETYKLELQFLASSNEAAPGDERIHDTVPLVVNTMGWTKGLGADLNTRIEEFVEASHTFDVEGAEDKGWPLLPQSQHVPQLSSTPSFMQTNVKRCIKVEAIRPDVASTYYTATDHRHLNIMSYFHAVFPDLPACSPPRDRSMLGQITATSWDTSLPLCARYPYEVDHTQALDRVYLTGPGYEDVVSSELARVLNGAIVGLVSTSGPADAVSRPTQSPPREASSLSYTPAEPPPDPTRSTCHGLALIRGMQRSPDARPPHMHVLTPLPTGFLAQTRVLVKGELELPIWGMLDFREDDLGRVAGVEKGHVPYLRWGKGEGIGGERWRVRRNLMRKGQA